MTVPEPPAQPDDVAGQDRREVGPHAIGGRRRVLLVEDFAEPRTLLPGALAADGFVVRRASSFKEALERVESAEIVVTELELGRRSGVDLIAAIRRRHPDVPVIAMSRDAALLQEATIAGAIGVLAAPFQLDQMRVVIMLAALASP